MNIQSLKLNIAKLVLGYLIDCNYSNTAQSFINECILFQNNSNIIPETEYKLSDDNLISIVEDYFESKKYAFIKSCDYMKTNQIKLKDILTVFCDKIENNNTEDSCSNKENQTIKRKSGRKRKLDAACPENHVNLSNNTQTKNMKFDVNNLTPMVDFMAYNINKSVPSFQPSPMGSKFRLPNESYLAEEWKVDVDSKNTDNNVMVDNFQDIFLETLESIYPSGKTAEEPIKRTDSLNTPDKKLFLLDKHLFSFMDSEKPNLNNGPFSCLSNNNINNSNIKGEVNLNNLWESIFNENDESSTDQFKIKNTCQNLTGIESQQTYIDSNAIKVVKLEQVDPNKNHVKSNSLSALEKEKILKSVDLNKVMEHLKNDRK